MKPLKCRYPSLTAYPRVQIGPKELSDMETLKNARGAMIAVTGMIAGTGMIATPAGIAKIAPTGGLPTIAPSPGMTSKRTPKMSPHRAQRNWDTEQASWKFQEKVLDSSGTPREGLFNTPATSSSPPKWFGNSTFETANGLRAKPGAAHAALSFTV
jgi:hypothetical protein